MREKNQPLLIDVENILKTKVPKYHRFVPKCLVHYLKKIVHQDSINDFLKRQQGSKGVDFLEAAIHRLGARVVVHGREHLPCGGLYTFVSNHPLGGLDGIILGHLLGRTYEGKVKYLVNDLLMNLEPLAPLFIPINKTGRQSRDFPRMVDAGFASDNQVIMFPAGLCSRKQKGVVRDVAWKKTFIVKSVAHQRDVVPIHFSGHNSPFFYRLANWCSRLHLPNFAMLYLADEMFKNEHKQFCLTIGEPISWRTFDKKRTPGEWAQWVKEKVYSLPEKKG